MDSSTVVGNSHATVSLENGERSSKMPTATFEQLNLAKLLSKQGNYAEHQRSVALLQDLANCTEDEAVTALHDCGNDIEKAVELLLDKAHSGLNNDWHTTGRKSRVKHKAANESDETAQIHTKKDRGTDKYKQDAVNMKPHKLKSEACSASPHDDSHDPPLHTKNTRGSKNLRNVHSISTESVESRSKDLSLKPVSRGVSFRDQRPGTKHIDLSDGWDPYTEYGEWGGEAIEVVNSNASLARGLQNDPVSGDDLFVETSGKAEHELASTRATDSSMEASSPKSVPHSDDDTLFISKALSDTPPRAFTELPNIPVFIIPDALPKTCSNLTFKFGGESSTAFQKSSTDKTNTSLDACPPSTKNTDGLHSTQESSPYSGMPAHAKIPSFETATGVTPGSSENKVENVSQNFASNQFPSAKIAAKPPSVSNVQNNPAFVSERSNAQSGFLDSSLKNYILENLPGEIGKLSINNTIVPNEASAQYLPVSSQPQPVNSSFNHGQSNSGSTIQQLGKAPAPHTTTHASFHGSQQSLSSGSSQQPHTTAMPPGMTHFISQFAPTPYHMFNLPGNSSNTPAVIEQLLHQQHRMFYDMHMHQQAATTSQSMLTSSSEVPASSKPHTVSGPSNHPTASGPAIRPDILASAMGHTPQMVPTGHPFFSYPSFVLMNGYPNTFMNQPHTGADPVGNTTQASAHGPSMTQAPTQPSQSFSGMKPMNAPYDEFMDMKYGDPSKQVGYKSQPSTNFGTFPGHMPSVDGSKLPPTGHGATNGVLNPGFGMNPGTGGSGNNQSFLPQYYQPGASTSAYLNAAVAAAQHQQQPPQQQASSGSAANQSNSGTVTGQSSANAGQMHQLGNGHTQSMVMGASGPLHHAHPSQRAVMSHQH